MTKPRTMNEKDKIEQIESAIKSISKGKDKKEDAVLMMAPFANWDRFLTPAPSAIAMLGELLLISTKTDFELIENMPTEGFRYIKYPKSFRACLVQVSNAGWNAFNEAHASMDKIRLLTGNVDMHIKDSIRILMGGTARGIEELLPSYLSSIQEIANDSFDLSKKIEEKFFFVMHLTEELLEASTNTKRTYQQKERDTETHKQIAKLEIKRAQDAKTEREKRYANIKEQVTWAQDQYTKAVESMPRVGDVVLLSITEGMVDTVKSVISFPKDILGHGREESINFVSGRLDGPYQQKTDKHDQAKTYKVKMAEHNVLNTVPMIHAQIQSLQRIIEDSDLNVIKNNIEHLEASFISHQENVIGEKNAGKIGERVSELCKKAIGICKEAHTISKALSSVKTVDELQKPVADLLTESMKLVAKANKTSGKNPLDERSPCLDNKPTQKENQNMLKSALDSARLKTEVAKEILKDTKDRQDTADKQLEEANERISEVLKTMEKLKLDEYDFTTIRKTLKQGIAALAHVRHQWGKLVIFFEEIANIISCCMQTSLKKFVQTVSTRRQLKKEGVMLSNAFRANMYEQTLHACRISYIVNTMAGGYVEISKEHLLEQISSLSDLIALDSEDDKDQITVERERLHKKCKEAQSAIKKKIKEQNEKYKEAARQRICRIEKEVEAILPFDEKSSAIQTAVKEGFKDPETNDTPLAKYDLDDLVG